MFTKWLTLFVIIKRVPKLKITQITILSAISGKPKSVHKTVEIHANKGNQYPNTYPIINTSINTSILVLTCKMRILLLHNKDNNIAHIADKADTIIITIL